jgi:hypothetical protein
MSGFRHRWRRSTAIVAIAGLLFHAALLLIHQPAIAAGGPLGDTIALCTSVGLKFVPFADLQNPDAPDPSPDHTGIAYCPVCLGAQLAGIYLPPAEAALPLPSFDSEMIAMASSDVGLCRASVRIPGSRAPPFIV